MVSKLAFITPANQDGFAVYYNPNQYSIDKSNQFAEIGIPGLPGPLIQYVRGNARTLAMELLFDTYELGTDVTEKTQQIYGLLGHEEDAPAPPICSIRWGQANNGAIFSGVLERVSGRFTLFLPDGTPVRATLSVSFKEAIDIEQAVRALPLRASHRDRTYIVRRGDTLSGIAATEYGDAALWPRIARYNNINNPRTIKPGKTLKIPS
jgi:LysM repeat protein